MGFDLKRFTEVAKPASEKELEEAKFRDENRDWLLKSSLIALEVRRFLRLNGMNQNQLAERMGISPAMVTKLLSGKENLGLKTICSIEKVIKADLLRIPCDERGAGTYVVWKVEEATNSKLDFEEGQSFCKIVDINKGITTKKKDIAV